MPKAGAVAGRVYYAVAFFLLATIGFGTAFIVLSMASRFFKWKVCIDIDVVVDTVVLLL